MSGTQPFDRRLTLVAAAWAALSVASCNSPPEGASPEGLDQDIDSLGAGGTNGDLPNGAAGTAPSSAGSGTASSLGGTGSAVPVVPVAMDFVLEDFEDGDGQLSSNGFSGRWRTYSDGTGTVTPAVDAPIVPEAGAVHVNGTGFSTWGVGLSVDLDDSSGPRAPVDLSEYRGFSLRAKGTGSLEVELVLPATTGTTEAGGTCTAGAGCFGHYSANLTLSADYTEQTLPFSAFQQPEWATSAERDLTQVLAVNFLSRANGAPVNIELWLDEVSLAVPPPVVGGPGSVVNDGSNPFAGRTLHSDGGAAFSAYDASSGADRELLGKIALNPTAFWLVGGDPGNAGRIVDGAGGDYTVLVAYNIPNRDCSGASQGGASSPAEYQGWIDGIANSLSGKEAAVILEPDALALSCGESTESLINYAVSSLRQNPGLAVYIDGGHSNWVAAGVMAQRLQNAGIAQATGFAINVSNFQPTSALVNYGKSLSALVGNKPFVVDTSRNGQGARGAEWCNPAGAGLGEAPTTSTGDALVQAFLWVKRPGESDGACGQCSGTPAGQFCTSYALELARNAIF